uniref:Uncharacterized protein n=1 Tax=Roseihalotalea indica TaxID=2867963 RepID=A0AA49JID1_9BACT|nr:hypothetical protein K4G66_18840 [Tunicatimonas sp. TK19036]
MKFKGDNYVSPVESNDLKSSLEDWTNKLTEQVNEIKYFGSKTIQDIKEQLLVHNPIKCHPLFLLAIALVTIVMSCESKCELEEIKTIFMSGGGGPRNSHYILINDFSRECMDSAAMMNIAWGYVDTVSEGLPPNILKFFNSDKDFYEGETSQDIQKINESCLLSLTLDIPLRKVKDFIFYNDKGDIIYWGKRWQPNGDNPDSSSIINTEKE